MAHKKRKRNRLSSVNTQKGHKLTPKHQSFVCAMLATGYNPSVVSSLVEEQYGITINPTTIRDSYLKRPKWKKKIARMRRFFEGQYMKHPLASKTNRLDYILKTLNEAYTWRLDKIHYDKDGNEISRVQKRNICLIPGLIREARVEIEGEKPLIDQSKHFHLTHEKKEQILANARKAFTKGLV